MQATLCVKAVVVGDSCVGKTSVLRAFTESVALSRSHDSLQMFQSMLEARVYSSVREEPVVLHVWDTCGQEKYRSLTASYYRGAHGCLVLFDVTKESSFENLTYWLHDLKEYTSTPEISAIIVGTKCHVGEDKREVTYDRAQKFAESVGIPYVEVSAEEGTNVTEVFEKLADLIIENMPSSQASLEIHKSVKLDQPSKKKQWCSC